MTPDPTLHHPPTGARPDTGRLVLAQLGAVVGFGLATGAAFLAALLLALVVAPDCRDTTTATDTLALKAGLAAIGAAWVAVPAMIGLLTRRRLRWLGVAWLAAAAGAATLALVIVVQAVATPVFCF